MPLDIVIRKPEKTREAADAARAKILEDRRKAELARKAAAAKAQEPKRNLPTKVVSQEYAERGNKTRTATTKRAEDKAEARALRRQQARETVRVRQARQRRLLKK